MRERPPARRCARSAVPCTRCCARTASCAVLCYVCCCAAHAGLCYACAGGGLQVPGWPAYSRCGLSKWGEHPFLSALLQSFPSISRCIRSSTTTCSPHNGIRSTECCCFCHTLHHLLPRPACTRAAAWCCGCCSTPSRPASLIAIKLHTAQPDLLCSVPAAVQRRGAAGAVPPQAADAGQLGRRCGSAGVGPGHSLVRGR